MTEYIPDLDWSLDKGRNKINEVLTESNDNSSQAKTTAESADTKATQALTNSQNTQQQLDTVIIESGTSDAETIQARTNERGKQFDILKDRLDNLDIEFEQRGVNVKWFGASGSDQSTTGSIASGSNELTVTDAIDFEVGQGILIEGAGTGGVAEVAELQITSAPTVAGQVVITLDGIATNVDVDPAIETTAIAVADKIRNTAFAGWTTGGTAGTDTVTFTCDTAGEKQDATYNENGTNATGAMITTTQGSSGGDLITSVNSISGTIITLADSASTDVSNVLVLHNDTQSIQNTLTAYENGYFPKNDTFLTDKLEAPNANTIITGNGNFKYSGNDLIIGDVSKAVHIPDTDVLKIIYVHEAWDIAEFLLIKSLGFNTIIHYLNGGTAERVLNSAQAVGLKVIIKAYNDDPTSITQFDDHPALYGYYLFDEPQHNSVTVSEQEVRINNYKQVTNKPLVITDNGVFGFNSETLSPNFDIILQDSYFSDNAGTSLGETNDISNKAAAIITHEEISNKAPNSRIIPAVGLFMQTNSFTLKDKIINFAKEFKDLFSNDGSFACFGWDAHTQDSTITNVVSNDIDFINVAREFTKSSKNKKKISIETYIFENDPIVGMHNLLPIYNSVYSNVNTKPFSVTNVGSATDERRSTFSYYGIGYAQSGGIFATNIRSLGNIIAKLVYSNKYNTATSNVALKSTIDDFYTNTDFLTKTDVANNTSIRTCSNVSRNLGVGIELQTTNDTTLHWKFLSGNIINSNWTTEVF